MKIFAIEIKLKHCWMLAIMSIMINQSSVFAQNEEYSIELQDLVVPNAPASAIIGSQISLQPAITPRAFGLSILNSIANEAGEFPNNIAVEFAPYWWSPKPDLTFDNYYDKNGFGEFISQSLSFSIASEASTRTIDDGSEIDVTKLGLGLRFALIAGEANPQVEKAKEDLENELRRCLELVDEEVEKRRILKQRLVENQEKLEQSDFEGLAETLSFFKDFYNIEGKPAIVLDELIADIKLIPYRQIDDEAKKAQLRAILFELSKEFYPEESDRNNSEYLSTIIDNISKDAKKARNNRCLEERDSKIGEFNTKLKDLDRARVGWQLESASAVGFDFRENDFDEFRFTNLATWLTASYRGTASEEKASPIEFLGVAKYTFDELEDDSNSFLDLGAGLVYRLPTTPLTFSLEYVRRFGDDEDDRFVGVADYRISNKYSVFLSYGKEFEDDFEGNDDLVTLFGLKLGLGRNPVATEEIK